MSPTTTKTVMTDMDTATGSDVADERRADIAAFLDSARGALSEVWADATAAGAARDTAADEQIEALHRLAVRQGWTELAEAEAPDFLLALQHLLGQRACDLGLADAYAAALLVPEFADQIADGTVRPVVLWSSVDRDVPTPVGRATHLVRVNAETGWVNVQRVASSARADSLAPGGWQLVSAGEEVPISGDQTVSTQQLAHVVALTRAAAAAHLIGSAARAHELAVEHAKTRRQFGRTIGAFGAVQQRVARCQIDLMASQALLDQAGSALASGDPSAPLAAALAARQVDDVVVDLLAGAQHTLGAIGYFDEHEVYWLFRSVHAGLTLVRHRERQLPVTSTLAQSLLDQDQRLPALALGPTAERFRGEVRDVLAAYRTDEGFDVEALRTDVADRGWFALSWPVDVGGLDASLEEQVVLNEEMKYAGGPVDRAMSATMLIGHSLLRHGTVEQKQRFLPLLRAGQMAFCLGYSEPEAGSDLASLSTRAVRDGDEWVITGQKLWTTRAQSASHVWLAVRTDPEAKPRHAGISIFLVDMTTPGITVHQHTALSGEISCTVFYDEVRVPAEALVGEVNGGWKVITDALAAERVVMGGIAATLLGHFDALVDQLRPRGTLDPRDADALERIAARLQAARALVLLATQAMSGQEARILGPVAAVLSGDLAEEFGRVALDLLGPAAAFSSSGPAGRFEHMLRLAPMYVIGGGTNDIQRGLIARSLGLARE